MLCSQATTNPMKLIAAHSNGLQRPRHKLPQLTPEDFATIKKTVIDELREPEKTMAERFTVLVDEAIDRDGTFGYFEHIAKTAESLTQAEVVSYF